MDLKSELLKSIWYAFTSLDVEHSGKVSKSQLKVLSHNLYTALNIPHDPVALEEHFQDDDNGPVSSNGYMPYLNQYILAKAVEGTFNKETFDDLCWMMTAKKNLKPTVLQGLCSHRDCFKLFCLFNLLSEDCYPLVIIQPELEYLLKKISTAMSQEWDGRLLEALLSKEPSLHDGLSVWMFLEKLSSECLMRVGSKEAFSLALEEVFIEMYHSVLKKGYILKKGHVRRNWQERWFVLKPGIMIYYVKEDQKEKKGEVQLDGSCVVETLPDKEGKHCLFCVKTPGKTYEMCAPDQKLRVEWIHVIQTALRLKAEGKSSLHQELKLRRREMREISQSDSLSSSSRKNSQTDSQKVQSTQSLLSSNQKVQSTQSLLSSNQNVQSTQSLLSSNQSVQSTQSLLSSNQSVQSTQSLLSSNQNVQSTQSLLSSNQSVQSTQSLLSSNQSVQSTQSLLSSNQSVQSTLGSLSRQSSQNSRSSQSEPPAEMEQSISETHYGETESKESDIEIIDIIQQHLEKEAQRKEEEAREKAKQQERLQELESQLAEANTARTSLVAELAKMESEVKQQKKRIHELELTQLKLEEALNLQIQDRLEEEKVRHELERQLEEEQNKLTEIQKQLDALTEKNQGELDHLKDKERSPPSASSSSVLTPSCKPQPTYPSTYPPTGAADTNWSVEKISESHSKAQYIRQWNVHLNRLMKPITPADKMERTPVKASCPKYDQALTSKEFITKYQSAITQELELPDSQSSSQDDADSLEQNTVSEVEEQLS